MNKIYADIEITNSTDLALVRHNIIAKDEMKYLQVSMCINSGAYMTAINEEIQTRLHLPLIEIRTVRMPDGSLVEHQVAGPLLMQFENRTATCNVFVLPGNSEPLLGSISFGEMDVVIDNVRQTMTVNPAHPDCAQLKMK